MSMTKMEATYYADEGVSVARLTVKDKEFIGVSTLLEGDRDSASSFAGCDFAMQKAQIKAIKHKYQEAKKELKTLENLYYDMSQLKNFHLEEHQPPARFLRKRIHIQRGKVEDYYNLYSFMQGNYLNYVEARLNGAKSIKKTIKKYQDKREALQKEFKND